MYVPNMNFTQVSALAAELEKTSAAAVRAQ